MTSPGQISKAGAEELTLNQIREIYAEQYALEKELADRLRAAPREERWRLYPEVYNAFYRRFPYLVRARKVFPELEGEALKAQMSLLRPYLGPEAVYLEMGPGDCSFALEVAKHVRMSIAADVSGEITAGLSPPPNFTLVLVQAGELPVEPGTVDVAYSADFIEHLHPEDAHEHLQKMHSVLKPGGIYLCCTPNRLSGPHDISMYFDRVATGLHLKEYGVSDLVALFRRAGFRGVRQRTGFRGRFFEASPAPASALETALEGLPVSWHRALAARTPLRQLLAVNVLGRK